jgi:16S rRNA (cytosine967-C5)-methyltransferase
VSAATRPVPAATEVTPARRVAFEVLRRTFEHDAWSDRALRSAVERHGLDERERALARRLAYGSVQRRGTSDHLITELSGGPAERLDDPVLAALRLGLYELLYLDGAAEHAAVSQAVELAKGGAGGGARRTRARAGFVNAVLRRAAREREALLAALGDETPERAAIAHSCPQWIAELWWRELDPEAARSLLAASNEPAETALRVNTLRAGRDSVLARLGEGFAVPPPSLLGPPEALIATGAIGDEAAGLIDDGTLVAQSRSSQGVVAALDPQPGERVLDLCAGPGIKATQIAARLDGEGEVVSVELDEARASQVGELCEWVGADNVVVKVADAAEADHGSGYDRVLVDPPCTDLGALASRPDARWRKQAGQSRRLAALQRQILGRGLDALRPGGALVYATCTISAAENEELVASVLEDRSDVAADDLGATEAALASARDPRFLQTRPDRDRSDGFFIARLRRGEP